MTRIQPLERQEADSETAETLTAVQNQLGMLPNLFATLAHAPAALQGYMQLNSSLGSGRLTTRQREMVALVVAQANQCQYCLSAHSLLAKNAGMSPEDITRARTGKADNDLDAVILKFAREVTRSRGAVADADFTAFVEHGLSPALMVEIVANVSVNILTNYINNLAHTDVDFPKVDVEIPNAA